MGFKTGNVKESEVSNELEEFREWVGSQRNKRKRRDFIRLVAIVFSFVILLALVGGLL